MQVQYFSDLIRTRKRTQAINLKVYIFEVSAKTNNPSLIKDFNIGLFMHILKCFPSFLDP